MEDFKNALLEGKYQYPSITNVYVIHSLKRRISRNLLILSQNQNIDALQWFGFD